MLLTLFQQGMSEMKIHCGKQLMKKSLGTLSSGRIGVIASRFHENVSFDLIAYSENKQKERATIWET